MTSKVIVELLFAVDDFKKLVDINSYIELGIDVCLDYGEYDRAEAIQKYILGETSNKLIDKIQTMNINQSILAYTLMTSIYFRMMEKIPFQNLLLRRSLLIERIISLQVVLMNT